MTVTKAQAVAAGQKHTVFHDERYGPCTATHVERWRSNSRCKTWPTRPREFRLSIKTGLRGFGFLTQDNAQHFHTEEDCPLNQQDVRGMTIDDLVNEAQKDV